MIGRLAAHRLGSHSRWLPALLLWFAGLRGLVEGYTLSLQYLLISSPSTGNIYYAKLPTLHDFIVAQTSSRPVSQAYVLIDGTTKCTGYGCLEDSDRGLQQPRSLAVHEGESLTEATLYVADTKGECIYAYTLRKSDVGGWLTATSQRRVLADAIVGGLAVDGVGNLFYTIAQGGQVNMLTSDYLRKAAEAVAAGDEPPKPQMVSLYGATSKGSSGAAVMEPMGIASDNFFVYWANHGGDEATGVLVKAPDAVGEEAVQFASSLQALASNTDLYQDVASHVCLARDTLFFTGDTPSLYAVKGTGGTIAEVAKNFSQPAGCVYDRMSTLYVADGGRDTVYSLAANFAGLRAVRYLTTAVHVPGPDSLALFGAATPRSGGRLGAQVPIHLIAILLFGVATLHQS